MFCLTLKPTEEDFLISDDVCRVKY